MSNQLLILSIYSFLFVSVFFLGEFVRRRFEHFKEFSRKTVHVLCGIMATTFPFFIHSHWSVLILVGTFSLLMILTKKHKMLLSIHDVKRKSHGSLYYPLAIYVIFLLGSHKPVFYMISIIVMTISDALAALIGEKYGIIKYEVEGNIKTLEGSTVFFLITFLCVHLPLILMTNMSPITTILIGIIIATLVTGFEAISPDGSDNFFIPFGTYFILIKITSIAPERVFLHFVTLLIVIAITACLFMLKPSGLIGIMLLNYAALTLGNIYWLVPLLLTEIVFFLIDVTSPVKNKEQYSVGVLFYMAILPTSFIFLDNAFHGQTLFFVPYLIAIASQMPISYHLKTQRAIIAPLSVIFVVLPSILLFYKQINPIALLTTLATIFIIYQINQKFRKKRNYRLAEKEEFRLRLASTAIGSFAALLFIYQGTHYV